MKVCEKTKNLPVFFCCLFAKNSITCIKSVFLSLEVKNLWIFNISWGGMKGPYGSFPFVIRIVKDIMWCLRGRIVIKLNKATSTDVKNRSVGSMRSNGS